MAWREIDHFECIGQDDGLAYIVRVWQDQRGVAELRDSKTPAGSIAYRLFDGRELVPEPVAAPVWFELPDTGQWICRV